MEIQNKIEQIQEPSKEQLKCIVPWMKYIINEMNYFRNDANMYIFWRNVYDTFKKKNRLQRIPHLTDA